MKPHPQWWVYAAFLALVISAGVCGVIICKVMTAHSVQYVIE